MVFLGISTVLFLGFIFHICMENIYAHTHIFLISWTLPPSLRKYLCIHFPTKVATDQFFSLHGALPYFHLECIFSKLTSVATLKSSLSSLYWNSTRSYFSLFFSDQCTSSWITLLRIQGKHAWWDFRLKTSFLPPYSDVFYTNWH